MRLTLSGIVLVLLTACTVAQTPKRGLRFSGAMYTDLMVLHNYRKDADDEGDFSGTSRLSLTFRNANRQYGKIEGSLDVLVLYGLQSSMAQLADTSVPGTLEIFALGQAPVLLDLRTLYMALYLPFADISLGRQIVNFGKGMLFSPLDVFSSVDIHDLDLRRSGSDVATAKFPIGDLAGVDIIGEIPFAGNPFSSALRAFASFGSFDVSLVGIYRNPGSDPAARHEGLTGVGFKGDAGVGIYGEAVVHFAENESRAFGEAMAGVDYSIRSRLLFAAEYLYRDYDLPESSWGEHNLFGSLQFVANDLLSLSGTIIYDIQRESALGTLLASYSVLQNVNLDAYVRGFTSSDALPYDFAYGARAEVKF